MPIEITPINNTTYEVELPGGDKVEIGDRDNIDFKPHLKLNRWDGECFIKVQLPTTKKILPTIEGDKVKWADSDIETHFYPLEPRIVIAKDKEGKDVKFRQCELGGFEFEAILKKKPKTNKIVLNIETQGLKFYYQPALTPEEIAEGAVRPDNVVGSYAVYHATRGNMHKGKATAEKYKCGIAFHIYRPLITDAEGKWVWGDLFLDEQAGTLTTTIPQEFLDSAVYPISTGTTNFGYETAGGSNWGISGNNIRWCGSGYSPASDGEALSMSLHGYDRYSKNALIAMALYIKTGVDTGTYEVNTSSVEIPDGATWVTADFPASHSILSSETYHLVFNHNDLFGIDYNSGDTDYKDAETFGNWPSLVGSSDGTRQFSIYCTYEAGGATYYHGLKVQGVGELALTDVGNNPLRIRKGGVTYGIEMVDNSDPNASPIRIKTSGGVKAIRKYT